MPEELLFADERRLQRADVASYLRTIADKLDVGEQFTLETGSDAVTLDVPGEVGSR